MKKTIQINPIEVIEKFEANVTTAIQQGLLPVGIIMMDFRDGEISFGHDGDIISDEDLLAVLKDLVQSVELNIATKNN